MPMPPERKAGILFAVAVVGILALIAVMLSTSRARGFEYSVMFKDGSGLRKGDRVQLNGVDIGVVRDVALDRTGESIKVDLEIDREHREKIQTNSTAYIKDATFPNVSGQKVVEVFNSAGGSPPLPPKSVVMGKESLAEVKAWQFKEQVGTWSEQLRTMVEDLSDAAKAGLERGKQKWAEAQEKAEEKAAPEAEAAEEESPAETGDEETAQAPPFDEGVNAPLLAERIEDETGFDANEGEETVRRFQTQEQGVAGAADLLKQFHGSEEYEALADRTIDILRRLSEKGVPSALAQIVLDWKELKKELEPAIGVLKDAGRMALAGRLEEMMRAVEEMIRMRQQQLEEEGGDVAPLVAPSESETIQI